MIGEYPGDILRTDEIRCARCGRIVARPDVVRVADHMERNRHEGSGMRCAVDTMQCRAYIQARAKFGAQIAARFLRMDSVTDDGRWTDEAIRGARHGAGTRWWW